MRERLEHKYDCLNKIENVIQNCKDNDAINLIIDLRELIFYQMHEIRNQRIEIIAMKHKNAWTHYDRPDSDYNTNTRSYTDINKPSSDKFLC